MMEPKGNQGIIDLETNQVNEFAQIDYSHVSEDVTFKKEHQEYIAKRLAMKKQEIQRKKDQFGSSSSSGSEDGEADIQKAQLPVANIEPIEPVVKKVENSQKTPIYSQTKKGGDWMKTQMVFNENKTINILGFSYQIKQFSKIKIISESVLGSPFKIKINCGQVEVLFAVNSDKQKFGLPYHYYTFAKLIQEKLFLCGVKLKENVNEKIEGVPETIALNSYKYGRICKKSQVLGNWEERFVMINKEGIYSFKKLNEKHTMFIPNNSIKELWTRYEVQQNLLIIKIMHNGRKTEFGLPLADYLSTKSWLFQFYSMMNSGK